MVPVLTNGTREPFGGVVESPVVPLKMPRTKSYLP